MNALRIRGVSQCNRFFGMFLGWGKVYIVSVKSVHRDNTWGWSMTSFVGAGGRCYILDTPKSVEYGVNNG